MSSDVTKRLLAEILEALGGGLMPEVDLAPGGSLPSAFPVSDLAQASVAAAGIAVARYVALSRGMSAPRVTASRELASAWFAASIRPDGWTLAPVWDAIAGDYPAADGWIRLHTNAPHHRAAALGVLQTPEDRDAVSSAVAGWRADELETAIVAAGGAAAAMRTPAAWAQHPTGAAVSAEPLLWVQSGATGPLPRPAGTPGQPLAGIRVLDLTRVIAGPVATRTLAGWGAEVLRIDPPDWEEQPAVVPELLVGKRTAKLDLRAEADLDVMRELLRGADVLIHGYRADALRGLGLGWSERQRLRPGLVDVSLNAYGWTGPWVNRRGFDSLVQMSSGIAEAGQRWADAARPTPLPVQALDHATGYIAAAAALSGLTARLLTGAGSRWRGSLARTAALLSAYRTDEPEDGTALTVPEPLPAVEATSWGPARRLPPPVSVDGSPLHWSLPARVIGSDPPQWSAAL